MSTKNIYLFKVVIHDTQTNSEVPVAAFKGLFQDVFNRHCLNGALKLDLRNSEPMMLDVIEDTDEYLFVRLNKKRPNNSIQKRNYNTYETSDVLAPDELLSSGVELFTYCILGYSHGILSIINSKGAPTASSLAQIFACYNNRYSLIVEPIPNQDLINELLEGNSPEINRVQIDIAQPNAQILEALFGFNDREILDEVGRKSSSIVFEVKPSFRGALSNDANIIARLIEALRNNRRYNSVVISGKKDSGERQRQYDLYEEYFKYPININEYRQENGNKIERDKKQIQKDLCKGMKSVYSDYKDIILAVSDR